MAIIRDLESVVHIFSVNRKKAIYLPWSQLDQDRLMSTTAREVTDLADSGSDDEPIAFTESNFHEKYYHELDCSSLWGLTTRGRAQGPCKQ
jgi:hypothetical protein